MTGYEALLVVLLAGFIVLSAVGGWLRSVAMIGIGLAALGVYLLCQLVRSL